MNNTPKCPGCGADMELMLLSCNSTFYYACAKCGWDSPTGIDPESAFRMAMRRAEPKNRVLTLAEVQNLAYVDYEQQRILTGEYKSIIKQAENVFCPCVVAHEDLNRVGVLEIYDGSSMKLREKSMYGKYWRCWLRKPSKEEMEETPWES